MCIFQCPVLFFFKSLQWLWQHHWIITCNIEEVQVEINIIYSHGGLHNCCSPCVASSWHSGSLLNIVNRHCCIHECRTFNSRGQSSEYWIWGIHIQRPEYDYCPIFKISELNSLSIFKVIFNLSNYFQVLGPNYKPGEKFSSLNFQFSQYFRQFSTTFKKN